ncbi:LytS/YhcK type 5TM receptor domain-containing protein [Ammoniphilus resinae]|uniref:LytS/YhcK type 5TM receptor domain-containing protein n=1 Tax=Ammoniphilus resinae TaxID=861532 RepID=UPI001AEABEEB
MDQGKLESQWNKMVVTFIAMIAAFLCMSYPVEFFPGFFFDLRQISLILAALYGGHWVSAWLYIGVFTYRFLLGGDGVYISFITVTLIFLILPFLSPWYTKLTIAQKLFTAVSFSVIFSSLTASLSEMFTATYINEMIFQFVFVQALGILLITYFIEFMRKRVKVREKN